MDNRPDGMLDGGLRGRGVADGDYGRAAVLVLPAVGEMPAAVASVEASTWEWQRMLR